MMGVGILGYYICKRSAVAMKSAIKVENMVEK